MREQHGCKIPFILMDSFSTSDDTRAFLSKAHKDLLQARRARRGGEGAGDKGG
jgi:UDP-N-acetylglucosamine pyrophosphorylase